MDRELQRYYEGQFTLFASEGWKDILEDMKRIRESISDITKVPDAQSLHFRQGQIDILDLLMNRKAMCEKAYEDLQNA